MTHLLTLLTSSPLVHRIGWTLLHFLWQGAAVALLLPPLPPLPTPPNPPSLAAPVALLLALLPPFLPRANRRYLAATSALLLMTLLPLATFPLIPTAALSVSP